MSRFRCVTAAWFDISLGMRQHVISLSFPGVSGDKKEKKDEN